jgi:hypothetical protein
MSEQKIYCGSGIGKFDNKLIEITVCLTDLPKEHIFEYEKKKYIKLKVQQKKEADKFNKTHSVEVNTWKPEKDAKKTEPKKNDFDDELENVKNLPF